MSCRASSDLQWGPGQAIPSILHGFGCLRQLWVSGQILLDTDIWTWWRSREMCFILTLLAGVIPRLSLCPHWGLLLCFRLQSWRLSLLFEGMGGPAACLSAVEHPQALPWESRAQPAWAELLPTVCPPLEPCFEEGSSQSSFFFPIDLAVLQGGESVFSFLIFEMKDTLSN